MDEAVAVVPATATAEKELALMLPIDITGVVIAPELQATARIIVSATMLQLQHNEQLYLAKEDEKLSARARKIKSYIEKSDFNCRSKTVAGLISLLIDEKITVADDENGHLKWVDGAIYVPVKKANDHNYPLGVPFVNLNGGQGVRLDGTIGNTCASRPSSHRAVKLADVMLVLSAEKALKKVHEYI